MNKRVLPMWVIYDHPNDQPDNFVARLWEIGDGPEPKPTGVFLLSSDIDMLREAFAAHGMVSLRRCPDDDPKIIETWL